MPVINPKHSCASFIFFIFYSPPPLSSMAGLNASLPCTNLCTGTIVYELKQ